MARTDKKTRIRLLPPRLQLRQKDVRTGSFPAKVRIASDNRTGNYTVNFDDTKTVPFLEYTVSSSATAPQHLGLDFDPIAFYTFDGTIDDGSGNSYDLSLASGTLQYTSGPFIGSQAVLFDGLTHLSSAIETALQITGSLTVQALFKATTITAPALPPFGNYIMSIGAVSESLESNILASLNINMNDKLGSVGYTLENGIGVDYLSSSNPNLASTNWHYLATVRDGDAEETTIYLDGVNLGSASHAGFPTKASSSNIQRILVGTQPLSDGNPVPLAFAGAVSNLKLVDRVLTPAEIESEYTKLFPRGIVGGLGFLSNDRTWINDRGKLDLPGTSSIPVVGTVRSQIIEGLPFFHFTPGQDLKPFRDNDHPAVDGKSNNETFYATGSRTVDVGMGFKQPLWAKTKIEIDMTTVGSSSFHTFFSSSGTEGFQSGTNYPMAYYNFATKKWEGIGVGRPLRGGGADSRAEFAIQGFTAGLIDIPEATGFGIPAGNPSFMNQMFEFQASAGTLTDKFGFPFDARYHATASQLYPLSGVINEPFLVEKIVVDFSGGLTFDPDIMDGAPGVLDLILTGAFVAASVSDFFILNQRRPFRLSYVNNDYVLDTFDDPDSFTYSLPTSSQLTNGADRTEVDTIRDMITYAGITSFASNMPTTDFTRSADTFLPDTPDLIKNPKQLLTRDFTIETGVALSNSLSALDWSGSYRLELTARSPNKINSQVMFDTERLENDVVKNSKGGRNSLGVTRPTGRDLRSPLATIQRTVPTTIFGEEFVIVEGDFQKTNPYILLPTDNLIFGWQQPIPMVFDDWKDITTGTGSMGNAGDGVVSTMTMTGPGRVILYGSSISGDSETHDTLNQLLISEAVHEAIGDD